MGRILAGAFLLPWANRVALMRATGVQLLLVVSAVLAWHVASFGDSDAAAWFAWAAFALSFAWLAITVHRLVLANGWEPRPIVAEMSARRLIYFVGAVVYLWAQYLVVKLLVMGLLLNVAYPPRYVPAGEVESPDSMNASVLGGMEIAADILAFWLIGRISLILPAIALDRMHKLTDIWRMSRGNAWKVAIVVGALPWVLDIIIGALWREGGTMLEVASLGILTGVFGIVGVVGLSLTYYELTHASSPPPTRPPG